MIARKSSGYIKLLGDSRNILDVPTVRDIRTASSLFMTREEEKHLRSVMDFRALGVVVRKEKDKFARQDAAADKFRRNYFRAREKLAATINKNRALMELRHELQERRRAGEEPVRARGSAKAVKPPMGGGGFNQVELRY